MNSSTLAALEFPRLLEWLASATAFSAGRERALALLPSTDPDEVERRIAATAEALALLAARPQLTLGGARDVRPSVDRALRGGVLAPAELLEIADTLAAADRWIVGLMRAESTSPVLAALVAPLDPQRALRAALANAIGDDGQVLDSASPELARLRAELRAAEERLRRRLQEMVASPTLRPALQEPIVTQREGRYVLAVRAEARGQLRGIVHDQSASGATLFVEPFEVVELSNRWRQRQREEAEEVERVLRALSQDVAARGPALIEVVEALAELDLHQAKARLAEATAGVRPLILRPPRAPGARALRLLDARHPLLERTLGRERVVPTSVTLGEDFDLLLITGPNTGGKTVALETVGLLVGMAQAGMFIPAAEGSELTIFSGVYADIGDEQSIEQSLSTFSSHIARIIEMLRRVDASTLVLLDELGAGTDPDEGAALGRALLDELLARGAVGIATTHYSELKAYAHVTPRVANASVEFDLDTLAPTYRLRVGLPGRSNALAIAARLGLPPAVIERARGYLHPQELEVASLIEGLRAASDAAQAERAAAARDREQAESERQRLDAALREAEELRARAWDEARAEARSELAQLQREVRELRRRVRRAGREPAEADAVAAAASALSAPAPPPRRAPRAPAAEPGTPSVRVGARVFVPSLGVNGTILAVDPHDGVEVGVGGMRVRVQADDLRASVAERRERTADVAPRVLVEEPGGRRVPLELDVRGMSREDAVTEVDRYVHDAFMAGVPRVRIIHGRGSGVVRAAVRDLLAGHPLVKESASAGRAEGGDGATVVALAV